MNPGIFFDVESLINFKDLSVLPGVMEGFEYYQPQIPRWLTIANYQPQSEVEAESLISQMDRILELLPLEAIYFCSDSQGLTCWRVTRSSASEISNHERVIEYDDHDRFKFCKPGAGMILLASVDFGIDLSKSWLISDSEDEQQVAANAGVMYMDAETWRMRFRPGMYQIKAATREQILFLESRNFSNDLN
ncbi:hypothetical protein F7734_10235 [Scytonema sp. UIC 10036]|uniref:hypothetical protein n=1 Tax=Scytonema sp. UIC 10036 TaxID=2304196 RepID=UPI0012DA4F9F|nr:hypothetical protein [Scytonema sp. UIC 10036]MUG92807.1 hypothetical protein [Scytonema sp. UIC 10036]